MPTSEPIFHEGPGAEARLNKLGLNQEWLIEAVVEGEGDRINCSPLEPSGAPGFKAWCTTFRVLAEHVLRLPNTEWVRLEPFNLPRIVNVKTRVAVAVLNGNDAVGDMRRDPTCKNPRGGHTDLLVRSNQWQMSLFEATPFMQVPPDAEQLTWWLLVFSDGMGGLKAELSLPTALGDDQRFSRFQERIAIAIPPQAFRAKPNRDETEPPVIEVEVKPKA